jgi:hypothetical protein
MITMVIIASAALMLTFGMMRKTAAGGMRRDRDGIRWRGIDWSAGREPEEDQFKNGQD